MATNPMQRRARNSFLVGILLTTLILGAVIAFLIYSMMNMQEKQKLLEASEVYVLNKDVSSGDEVTEDDLQLIKVSKDVTPSNIVSPASFTETNKDETSTTKKVISKINIKSGTIITSDMLYTDSSTIGKDVRKQEYNTIVLPMDLETGNFVDIRLLMPSGQDFIVVSKKRVEIPQISGVDSTDTISMELSEDEILSMSNAIIESYMIDGSKLYATKYTDAGNQEASTPTYPVNSEVRQLMNNEHEFENILETAWAGLVKRLNSDNSKRLREESINAAINSVENAKDNEKTKMEQSITNSTSTREEYLQSLTGTPANTSSSSSSE